MSVQQTSKDAYTLLKDSGRADSQRDRIMIVLRFAAFPMTNREIAKCLGMEPSTVSARRNELMDARKIRSVGKRKCKVSKITALVWEAVK